MMKIAMVAGVGLFGQLMVSIGAADEMGAVMAFAAALALYLWDSASR
jgi:hypothetical protein